MNPPTKQLFKFDAVFDFQRGKRLIELDQVEGSIAYISSSKSNNGIGGYINPPDFMTVYSNKMTLSNSGSVGYLFYHDYDFVASDHCTVIWIKDEKVQLTKYIYMYLKPIIEMMRPRYNFGREINNQRLQKEFVELPVNEQGEIDWQYMERFIKSLTPSINFTKVDSAITGEPALDISDWKEFSLLEVFDEIQSGKVSNAALLQDGSDLPYIGAKKTDSGVVRMVADSDEASEGPCFAFICDGDGSVGYTNYLPFNRFIATVNVRLGYSSKLTLKSGLFLVAVLDLQRQKYSFGRKWGKRLDSTIVWLPATADGQPDWHYMEQFIDTTPFADKL